MRLGGAGVNEEYGRTNLTRWRRRGYGTGLLSVYRTRSELLDEVPEFVSTKRQP